MHSNRKRFLTLVLGLFLLCLGFGCQKTDPVVHSFSPSPTPELAPNKPVKTPTAKTPDSLRLRIEGNHVILELPWPKAKLFRGYRSLSGLPRESRAEVPVKDSKASDTKAPPGVKLFYLAEAPNGERISASAVLPEKKLPNLVAPEFEVDKSNVTLNVRDQGQIVKRYPIALGGNPLNRKFCQDMASTPEGWYEIYNLQPNATYHRAYDIDYPRPIDYVRLELAIELGVVEASRPVGGEIQIHGEGIGWNWTAGCMALRNEDMDELFTDSAIRVGTKVYIAGPQLGLKDKNWLQNPPQEAVRKVQRALKKAKLYQGALDGVLGDGTALALGRYQNEKGLPMSCQLDSKTRSHFQIQ